VQGSTPRRASPNGILRWLFALALALAVFPAPALAATETFETAGTTTWTVPEGITSATFDVYGAQGEETGIFGSGGLGGRARANIAVTPGDVLQINVGGAGSDGSGGSNGGGDGGSGGDFELDEGGGGGGGSDVRRGAFALADRFIVAGGGGGAGGGAGDGPPCPPFCFFFAGESGGADRFMSAGGPVGITEVCNPLEEFCLPPCFPFCGSGGSGGAGGGTTGGSASGGGGTQSSGGSADYGPFGAEESDAEAGAAGAGGRGDCVDEFIFSGCGGGGGGGWYGGGGATLGGGGGGSGYGPANVVFETGVRSGNGKVVITYPAENSAPTATDDSATVDEDSGATQLNVLANDTDAENDAIEITNVSDPANGSASVVEGSPDKVSYSPDPNYCNDPPGTAKDSFTYTVNGGDSATVSVTVTCVDDKPTANDDPFTVDEDSGATQLGVLANDTDPENDEIQIESVGDPTGGTATVVDGSPDKISYTPDPNYCNDPPGSSKDTFTYTVNGGDDAAVSVTVTCVDDKPVANDDTAGVSEDAAATELTVLDNDSDVDAGEKKIESAEQPANGTVVVAADGSSLTYTPDPNYCNDPPGTAKDSFTYTVNGGDSATVSVTVSCVDDPAPASAEKKPDPGNPGAGGVLGQARFSSCGVPTGALSGRTLGPATLGQSRSALRRRFPRFRLRFGAQLFCFQGGGTLRVAYMTNLALSQISARPRRGDRAVLILTTAPRYAARGLKKGATVRTLRKRFPRAWSIRVGKNRWYVAGGRRAATVFKTRGRRVRSVGIAEPRPLRTRRGARRFFKRLGR
jgi:Bacterial Ig domain/Glycine rich protein/Bacterial cadherin-like domain